MKNINLNHIPILKLKVIFKLFTINDKQITRKGHIYIQIHTKL